MTFAIDDDVAAAVGSARRGLRGLVIAVVLLGSGALASATGGVLAHPIWLLAALPISARVGVLVRQVGQLQTTARLDVRVPADVAIEGHQVTIRHPTLRRPLVVGREAIRAAAIDVEGEHRFAIRRAPGTLHPLDEPSHLLTPDGARLGTPSVPLVSPLLVDRPPNVAVLFRHPHPIEVAAPAMASPDGWRPEDAALGRPPLRYGRSWRTMSAPGLYLRLDDPVAFATALGVRVGLTCDDWSAVTGDAHP